MNIILLSILIGCVFGKIEDLTTEHGIGLWNKYGEQDFVHEAEHLREEANKLHYLIISQQITRDEVIFYRIKLHDFNRDDKLDGLELIQLVNHWFHESNNESISFERIIDEVDQLISNLDANNDGFIDYGESVKGSRSNNR